MLSAQETLDTYYLEARRDLLEIAAFLDRYDRAAERDGAKAGDESKRESLLEALSLLAESEHPKANRAEQLHRCGHWTTRSLVSKQWRWHLQRGEFGVGHRGPRSWFVSNLVGFQLGRLGGSLCGQ